MVSLVSRSLFFVFCAMSSALSAEYVGNLRGSLSVEEGQAVYRVPVNLPRGPNNIQPTLNLVYNSGSGNGPLGLGWSFDMLSAVSRCSQTIAQDGQVRGVRYDQGDRFCLDGQRLVVVTGEYGSHGSVYKTEVDTYSKIQAIGQHGSGPAAFRVWTKDGRILDYGRTRHAQMIGTNQPAVHLWNLEQISDRVGNSVNITYKEGSNFPAEISYGITTVSLRYGSRPDTSTMYFNGGELANVTQRMEGIEIYNPALLQKYLFNYEENRSVDSDHSLLASMQLCDASGNCLKPLSFDYDESQKIIKSLPLATNPTGEFGSGWSVSENPRIMKDMNGDGFADIVGFDASCVRVALNDGNGSFASSQCWVHAFGHSDGWRAVNHPRELADINGDGLPDVVGFSNDGVQVAFNTGSYLKAPNVLLTDFCYSKGYRTQNHLRFVIDVNGDGRDDIIAFDNSGVRVALSKGETFEPVGQWLDHYGYSSGWRIVNHPRFLRDVNGDGLPDVVGMGDNGVEVALNTGHSFSTPTTWIDAYTYKRTWRTQHNPRFVEDINGDGLADIVGFGSAGVYVSLSTGSSFTSSQLVLSGFGYSAGGWRVANHPRLLADMSGDGLLDIVGFSNAGVEISYNVGNGKFAQAHLALGAFGYKAGSWRVPNMHRYLTDVTGDGIADVVGFENNGMWLSINENRRPLINTFTDSFQVSQKVSYVSLANAMKKDIYVTNKYRPEYPAQSLVLPISVVKYIEHNAGTYASNRTTFTYGGYQLNLMGRGSQGFRWNMAKDSLNRSVFTEYHQNFPLTGKVKVIRRGVLQTNSTLPIDSTRAVLSHEIVQSSPTYDVMLAKEVVTVYDLDGQEISEVETSYTGSNGYGDPLQITSKTSGGGQTFVTRTHNVYQEDTVHWIVGRLVSTRVTQECPCNEPITRETTFEYDAATGFLLAQTIGPDNDLSLQTSFTYDKYGNVIQKTETPGRQKGLVRLVNTVYDNNGIFMVSSANSKGHIEHYDYDEMSGKLLNLTGANGLRTTWTYDMLGRKIGENRADGTVVIWTYNWDNSLPNSKYNIQMSSPGSPTKTRVFDALDRVVRETSVGFNGENVHEDLVYNREGLVHKHSFPHFDSEPYVWTVYEYDVLDRLVFKSYPGPDVSMAVERIWYSGLRNIETDPLGNVKILEHDVLGRLKKVTDALDGSIHYNYDCIGNLVETQDAEGAIITTEYDLRGHKSKVIDPNMGTWEYKHNAFGELIWQRDAKLNILTQQYDDLGRIVRRTELEGSTTWKYDTKPNGLGKLDYVEGPDGYKRSFFYDDHGRENKVVTILDGKRYDIKTVYGIYGRISQQAFPNGESLFKKYNNHGYLIEVGSGTTSKADHASSVVWEALEYDAAGRMKKELYGNKLITDYEYDASYHLTGITTHRDGEEMLRHLEYSYDLNANLMARTDLLQSVSETFKYDKLDRLLQSTVISNDGSNYKRRQNWDYSPNGNIQFNDVYGLGPFKYHSDKPHALVKAGNNTYTYDANGNVKERNGKAIHWTSFNKPSRFESSSGDIVFRYGPDRSRYSKQKGSEKTLYLGKMYEVKTVNNVSTSKIYIYGAMGRLVATLAKNLTMADTVLTYAHSDNLGSVDTITDENGEIIERMNYDAFGLRRLGNWLTADSKSKVGIRGFTGHEHLDELGLVHMNGRVYDPAVGRFLSPDPHVQDPTNTQALNRYSYALNNPLKHNDPSGFFFKKLKKLVKKFWKPVVAAVVSYATFGLATPLVTGLVAATGITGAAASVATGVVAGAVSGFAGGTIVSGDIKGGLQGAVGGALLGGIAGHYGGSWNVDRVVAQATAGGVVSEIGGGKFKDGFALAGLAASARYLYNSVVGYDVDPKPGGPALEKGENDYPYVGRNNVGIQGKAPDSSWFDEDQFLGVNWGEGGGASRMLNRVPGINAVAGMHDVFQVELDKVFFPGARDIFNVPGMLPAAAVSYAALRDGPGMPALLVDETRKHKQ